jgi:hypothetical protein
MRDRNMGVMKDHGDHGYNDRDNEGDLSRWCEPKHCGFPSEKPVIGQSDFSFYRFSSGLFVALSNRLSMLGISSSSARATLAQFLASELALSL